MFSLKAYLRSEFSVTEKEWGLICTYLHEVDFPKNEFFVKHGKACRKAAFIAEGVMRYFDEGEHEEAPTCYFTFEGHYVLDPFTYSQQLPATLNLKSVTDCKLTVISYEDEQKLIAAFPRWKDITTKMLLDVSMEFANQKTMMGLNAAERYAYFNEHYPHLILRVPLQHIASYLGIAQPSLSRLRKMRMTKK